MSSKLIAIVYLCASLTSCNRQEEMIIGDWKYLPPPTENDRPKLPGEGKYGRSFLKNGIYISKPAFIQYTRVNKEPRSIFHGDETQYKIDGDSLKIFNPITKHWYIEKIYAITKDTIIFKSGDNRFYTYARMHYPSENNQSFDQVIISSRGCYGDCPINDVSIKKNGEIIFYGVSYNELSGLHKGFINNSIFLKLQKLFNDADIATLKSEYPGHIDGESIDITFVKNNSIVKSINSGHGACPAEFFWAYTYGRYLYQHATMDTVITPDYLPNPVQCSNLISIDSNRFLSKSEAFLLFTQLMAGNISKSNEKKTMTIKTDGRHFIFPRKGKDAISVDIGRKFGN